MVVINIKNLDRLAATLANKRKSLGLSQSQLAERSGVDQSTIAYIESGKRLPSVPKLLSILNELQMVMSLEDEK